MCLLSLVCVSHDIITLCSVVISVIRIGLNTTETLLWGVAHTILVSASVPIGPFDLELTA